MAELEIHHEVEGSDPLGRKVGIVAAVLAVLLAVVTIVSHRAHTDAVLLKSEANDKWSFYQAKRIKFHSLELGEDLLNAMPEKGPAAARTLERYIAEKQRYTKESAEAQDDARQSDKEAAHIEDRALRYDIGEGLLEIGLVLTSLYFISRSKLFPAIGIIAAAAGTAIAALGLIT
ncbi:MAG: DUF4337 domain-containing protein [Bryobacteraceae bacterium]|jgi:hypothetical protein